MTIHLRKEYVAYVLTQERKGSQEQAAEGLPFWWKQSKGILSIIYGRGNEVFYSFWSYGGKESWLLSSFCLSLYPFTRALCMPGKDYAAELYLQSQKIFL